MKQQIIVCFFVYFHTNNTRSLVHIKHIAHPHWTIDCIAKSFMRVKEKETKKTHLQYAHIHQVLSVSFFMCVDNTSSYHRAYRMCAVHVSLLFLFIFLNRIIRLFIVVVVFQSRQTG